MIRVLILAVFVSWFLGMGEAPAKSDSPPHKAWFPRAPLLPRPTETAIRATTVAELFAAARQVQPGGTILVADGHYSLPQMLDLHTDRVTLRSESGQRDKVILDGHGQLGELVGITRCSGVTIADLTIQNARWNGFKLNSDHGVTRVTIYNCVIHNIWQRGIKGVTVPKKNRDQLRPTDCRVQYCLFYNDRPKKFSDDDADRPDNFNGNYIGGMDIMYARRWTISDNVFLGIQGRTREGRGAIFLWVDAQDCIVERNIIVDGDCGICLGNSFRSADTPVHCTRCIVCNNFVTRCPENGILADYTKDCKILQNSIHDPESRLQRLIRLVHDNDGLVVRNNLLNGANVRVETQSRIDSGGNDSGKDRAAWFVSASEGNLHLKPGKPITKVTVPRLEDVLEDIDGQKRTNPTVVGADQP